MKKLYEVEYRTAIISKHTVIASDEDEANYYLDNLLFGEILDSDWNYEDQEMISIDEIEDVDDDEDNGIAY